MSKQIFCSLDLEGTGLDPAKDAITEVGATLFEVDPMGKIKFGKTFSCLVKPGIPIPPFIQELTGIRERDVADAPVWEDVLPKFKKFVGSHIIVGQNVGFDLGFLSARGLDFAQPFIDTKELAQIFLPEVGHYNLEYLLRYFGVEQKTQHRALADAQFTAELLGRIIGAFHQLSQDVQEKAAGLLAGAKLPYEKLFLPAKTGVLAPVAGRQETLFGAQATEKPQEVELAKDEPDYVLENFSKIAEGQYLVDLSAEGIGGADVRAVLAAWPGSDGVIFSSPNQNVFLENAEWAHHHGWKILDEPGNYFCEERFKILSNLANPSAGLRQFLIKLLIWRFRKPEGKFSELAMSGEEFFYRRLVGCEFGTCAVHEKNSRDGCELSQIHSALREGKKIFTHHAAWLAAAAAMQKFETGIFWDAEALEKAVQRESTRTHSLPGIRWGIKNLFDPESGTGILEKPGADLKKLFERTLNTLDLSFGLMSMALAEEPGFPQRVVNNEMRDGEVFEKIKNAALSFSGEFGELIGEVNKLELAPDAERVKLWLVKYLEEANVFIKEFFDSPRRDTVVWFDFFNRRLKLKSLKARKNIFAQERFRRLAITGLFGTTAVKEYFKRIFDLKDAAELDTAAKSRRTLEIYLPENNRGSRGASSLRLLSGILQKTSGRTLVVFNSQKAVEESYENFLGGSLKGRLFAERVTGHHWKNLESYTARKEAIWFLPARQFLEKLDSLPPTSLLVIVRIPYEVPGVQESFYDPDEVFAEFILPKTAVRLGQMVCRFTNSGETGGDKKIIFLDNRISLDYNEPLLDFLGSKYEVRISEYSPDEDPGFFGAKGNTG
jgi:DNA polymerase III epsilon subunit-like protein